MKNQFAAEYQKHLDLLAQYRAAKVAGDQATMEQVREARRELTASIEAKGHIYCRLYDKYASAQERGNEYIDWDDTIWDDQVEGFVKGLRDNGIEKFVFSSGWSSAVETAWLLQQNGCKLEGLVEINGHEKAYGEEGYDKRHGYLFSVK